MARRKGSLLRKLLILTGVLVLVLIAAFFVLTNGSFLKAVVLPMAGKSMNATIEVGDLALSPFSQLQLRQFKLTPTGQNQPLFQAEEILVRYRLPALLTGSLELPEIRIIAPTVNLTQDASGRMNLDPLIESGTDRSSKEAGPLKLDLQRLSVAGGSVRFARQQADGSTQVTELLELKLDATNLKNGQTGTFKGTARLSQDNQAPAGSAAPSGRLAAGLDISLELALDADLRPVQVRGNALLPITTASGAFADLTNLTGRLTCDWDTNMVNELRLSFERSGQTLGQVLLSGPFNVATTEGRLRLELSSIDRNTLNLFGAAWGIDFAATKIDATALLDLAKLGNAINLTGRFQGRELGVRVGDQVTPPLDLDLDYVAAVNLEEKNFRLSRFAVNGTSGGQPLLSASLTEAMQISWGSSAQAFYDFHMEMTVTNLDLARWSAFLGPQPPLGRVSASLQITTEADGKRLTGQLTAQAREVSLTVGTNRFDQLQFDLQTALALNNFELILADALSLTVGQGDTTLTKAEGSISVNLNTSETRAQINAESELAALLARFPVPDLTVQSGRLTLAGLFHQGQGKTNLTASANLSGLNGKYLDTPLVGVNARLESDLGIVGEVLELRHVSLTGQRGVVAGGVVDLSGRVNLTTLAGDLKLSLAGVNQHALGIFVDPMIAPLKLSSVALDGLATVQYLPVGTSKISLQTSLVKLLLDDPARRLPGEPLSFHLELDATSDGQRHELSRALLALPATSRATNVLTATASLDTSSTNQAAGTLRLRSEAMDFTPLYDAYMAVTNQAASVPSGPAAPRSQPETEPPALRLPVRQFAIDAQIDRLYLRDLALTQLVAQTRLSNDVLTLDPWSFSLNGGPVSAASTVNLALPGYKYDGRLTATNVPIAPAQSLADVPVESRLQGDAAGTLSFQGAGITGPNIQRNLRASFSGGSTNLNLALSEVRSAMVKSLVNVILSLPDLIRSPTATVGNLLGSLTGQSREGGGWVDDLTRAPINTVLFRGAVADGRLDLQQALVQSLAFQATARGGVVLAPVLTNSTLEIPVSIALQRALAEKAGLLAAGSPTNEPYASLPDFYTLRGTVGVPKNDLNKLALAGLAARASAGLLGSTGNTNLVKTSDLLGTVSSLLTGTASGAAVPGTNAPPASTNAPPAATNAPAKINPLQLLQDLLPKN
ncbi:MAG: DUF748 domain-containing protein [Limisphaerales bacterium]